MRIDKLFVIGAMLVGAFAFSACSDDDDYQPGLPAGENNVTFLTYSYPVMEKTATTFDVTLNRHTTQGTLSVPVEKVIVPEGWNVPETASFAAGDSLATITVTPAADMSLNTDYQFVIRVPESYTNSYKQNYGHETNTYKVEVVKEDYETFATGTYNELFFTVDDDNPNGMQWPVTIEYSPGLDVYRIKSMLEPIDDVAGYHFYFKWNKETGDKQSFTLCASDGGKQTSTQAGFEYGNYGMVSYGWAAKTNDPSKYTDEDNKANFGGYVASENMFVLPWKHNVSAGSFGVGTDFIRDVKFAK